MRIGELADKKDNVVSKFTNRETPQNSNRNCIAHARRRIATDIILIKINNAT